MSYFSPSYEEIAVKLNSRGQLLILFRIYSQNCCLFLIKTGRQIQLKIKTYPMATKALKNEKSGILSQKDLDTFFCDEKNLIKRNSASLNRSQCNTSPKSSSDFKDDKSQVQNTTNQLEEYTQKLGRSLNLERSRNEVLSAQILALKNELNIQKTMGKNLGIQKGRLVEELHYIRKNHEQIQTQRNNLLSQIGKLRHEISGLRATIDVNEEKIDTLQHTNKKLIDELNFEREMLADHKQQNAMFKANLKNISQAFINLKQLFTVEREKEIANVKEMMNKKINELRENLAKYKNQVREIKRQQKQLIECKTQIFAFVRKLLINHQSIKTELNLSKSFASDNFGENTGFLARQDEYKKTIGQQEQKIRNLSLEVANLKKTNMQLTDEIKATTHVELLAPRFHTNTSYINKVIKQNHREIKEIKDLVEIKDDQIARMRQLLQIQQSTSKAKSEEIQRLKVHSNVQQNNKYNELTGQIEELKIEKLRLTRKIDQLNQSQQTLKNEIANKDKIILNYVQKSKEKI